MSFDMFTNLLEALIIAIMGAIVYRYFEKPYFKISISGPFNLKIGDHKKNMLISSYRLIIKNDRKIKDVLGNYAKGCICEVVFRDGLDIWRLPWLYGELYSLDRLRIDLNSGTNGQIDFCARVSCQENYGFGVGAIISPLNGAYTNARLIGGGTKTIFGEIVISSENRGYIKNSFAIFPKGNDNLEIEIRKKIVVKKNIQ